MAIGTGDSIEKFGTQTPVTQAGVSIVDGAMSQLADTVPWTNTDDAPEADLVLEATFAAAPSSNRSVSIFARKIDVRSVFDENQPSIGDSEYHLVGNFPLDSSTATQVRTCRIDLLNGRTAQEYEFYFKNDGGQNINTMQSWITPVTTGPHP